MSTDKNINSYLTFKLADEVFAIHVAQVMEIIEVSRITKIPQTPNFMRGITNLRGSVLPIIESRVKFGMSSTEDTVDTCIIVLSIQMDGETVSVGALVDAVVEVIDIQEGQVKARPTIGKKYATEYIKGIAQIDERFIILLDIDKVFSDDEITLLKENAISNDSEGSEKSEVEENSPLFEDL